MKRLSVSVPDKLVQQIEEVATLNGIGSTSGLCAELLRLGLSSFCEQNNKVMINLGLLRKEPNDG